MLPILRANNGKKFTKVEEAYERMPKVQLKKQCLSNEENI
jgi:hypothetical protein